jgi:hypothetical protein
MGYVFFIISINTLRPNPQSHITRNSSTLQLTLFRTPTMFLTPTKPMTINDGADSYWKERRISRFRTAASAAEYVKELGPSVASEWAALSEKRVKQNVEDTEEAEAIEHVVLEMKRLLVDIGHADEYLYVDMAFFAKVASRVTQNEKTVSEYKKVVTAAAAAGAAAIRRTAIFKTGHATGDFILKDALTCYINDSPADSLRETLSEEWFRVVASATAVAVAKTYMASSLTGAEDRPPGRTGAGFRNVAVVSRRAGLMFFKQVVVVIAAAADDAKLFRGQSHTSMENYIDTESESESESESMFGVGE